MYTAKEVYIWFENTCFKTYVTYNLNTCCRLLNTLFMRIETKYSATEATREKKDVECPAIVLHDMLPRNFLLATVLQISRGSTKRKDPIVLQSALCQTPLKVKTNVRQIAIGSIVFAVKNSSFRNEERWSTCQDYAGPRLFLVILNASSGDAFGPLGSKDQRIKGQ